MKTSTVVRHIVAALTVTQASGRWITKNEGFEFRVRNVSASEHEASMQNTTTTTTTTIMPEATMPANRTTMDMLDLSDEFSKFAVSNDSDMHAMGWEIPVSHSSCTGWSLRPLDITDSIQKLINWSDRGGRLIGKSVHYEVSGGASAYACNCKLRYDDELPERELAEFYQRLTLWCGHGRSGWVFSKKWEKGFAMDTAFTVTAKKPVRGLCPPFCCLINV
ncbi:hypothetical protein M434DRAFT_17526 [Hypoxylon sp. CO27-5]|nr:hypothetical protein M434DRAFT_17526 [Hypoxylon sp. CO27-5]